MNKSNHGDKFLRLRDEYPFFIYEDYAYAHTEHGIEIRFHFNLSGKYHFYPTTFIPAKSFFLPENELDRLLPNLVFHLGLIELISYWKAACSPEVIVKPHPLSPEQVLWWKRIWFNGLGEFFYLNKIETSLSDFLEVKTVPGIPLSALDNALSDSIIVPVGGGKDSVVTLELLKRRQAVTPLIINPRSASVHSIFTAGCSHADMIGIHRNLDPLLLELNQQGFLNGHTPFSALLAFTSLLSAVISGKKYIALSNESSANESTVPGLSVNHQYSKSFGFEMDFRDYARRFLHTQADYFSLLRPLNELQIAGLFSRYPSYFQVFRSCNAGSKTDSWCRKCPKCLFTYIILSPFLPVNELIRIFGDNLLNDISLKPVFDQLIGVATDKQFACVGTLSAVNAALAETLTRKQGEVLPALLEYYQGLVLPRRDASSFSSLLQDWNLDHCLPPFLEDVVKGAIYG